MSDPPSEGVRIFLASANGDQAISAIRSKIEIQRFASPTELLESVGAHLRQREAENNLVLGVCGDIARGKYSDGPSPLLLGIQENGLSVGAAVMTPPHDLLITRLPIAAIDLLIDFLVQSKVSPPGLAGPVPEAATFVRGWVDRTGQKTVLQCDQRLYSCERIVSIPQTPGLLRVAEPRDQSILAEWIELFAEEAHVCLPANSTAAFVAGGIEREGFFVWDNDGPVVLAAKTRNTGNCISISYVFTPPRDRLRGYATACVAALTQRLLAEGKDTRCLYADLANPTANNVYLKIGYQPVCDAQVWRFSD